VQSYRCNDSYPKLYSGIKQSIEGFVAIIFGLFFKTIFKGWKKSKGNNCHNHEEVSHLINTIKKRDDIYDKDDKRGTYFNFFKSLIYTGESDGLFSNNPSTYAEVYEKINKSNLFA
jgi:hypothetical protein